MLHMYTTTSALCCSQNKPASTTSLSPSHIHSLPTVPRLFARGFPLFLFYLCTHFMTPGPPVSCCLTYPPPPPPHIYSFSPPLFLFPPTMHRPCPILASARSQILRFLFLFPSQRLEKYPVLRSSPRTFSPAPFISINLKDCRYFS